MDWVNNNNGAWTANGTASANSYPSGGTKLYALGVLPAGNYTGSVYGNDKTSIDTRFNVRIGKGSASGYVVSAAGKATFTADGESEYYYSFSLPSGTTADNLTVYPQLETGDMPSGRWYSYSNICPIYGHDSATAHRTGKNLAHTFDNAGTTNGVTWEVNNDGSVRVYGTPTGSATRYVTSNFVLPAGEYVFSGAPHGSSNSIMDMLLANMNTSAIIARSYDGTADDHFTLTEPTPIRYGIRCSSGASETSYDGIFYPMIRLASDTDATYEPYQADTYTVQFDDTIYGGTLDFVTGVLTATWGYIASYNGETLPAEWISDRDVYAAGTTPTTGAAVAYKLATPQTIQVTPQEITTLLGTNNIWATTETNEP